MKTLMLLGTSALLVVSFQANAQTIYRCKDAKGRNTYSQTPCASKGNKETGQRGFRPEADAPHDYSPRPQVTYEDYGSQRSSGTGTAVGISGGYYEAEERRKARDMEMERMRMEARRAKSDRIRDSRVTLTDPRTGRIINAVRTGPNTATDPSTGKTYFLHN